MTGSPLPGLPGSDAGPGDGAAEPACFEGLLADTSSPDSHAQHLLEDHADVVGPLVVRAGELEAFRDALPEGSHAVRVHLVADAEDERDGLATLREARNGLFDDDRVDVVGVQLALPAAAEPAVAAAALLDALDFTAPAWIRVPLVAGWEAALDVVASDGTENVAVDLAADPAALAAFVRAAVDLDVTFRVTGGAPDGRADAVRAAAPATDPAAAPNGLLNLLCAVRAALDGASAPEVADVLACTEPAPLVSAVRRMSAADAAVARGFLASMDTGDVGGTVAQLRDLGLLQA